MTYYESLLKAIPAIKIVLWQHLDSLYLTKLRDLRITPHLKTIRVELYLGRLTPEEKKSIDQLVHGVVAKFIPVAPVVVYDQTKVTTAKSIFLNFLRRREKRKEFKKSEPIFNFTRYKVQLKDIAGVIVRVRGKKGLRRYMAVASHGKILRGTKLKQQRDIYTGQILEPRGTVGVKITLIKKLPDTLKPTLVIRKDTKIPRTVREHLSDYNIARK